MQSKSDVSDMDKIIYLLQHCSSLENPMNSISFENEVSVDDEEYILPEYPNFEDIYAHFTQYVKRRCYDDFNNQRPRTLIDVMMYCEDHNIIFKSKESEDVSEVNKILYMKNIAIKIAHEIQNVKDLKGRCKCFIAEIPVFNDQEERHHADNAYYINKQLCLEFEYIHSKRCKCTLY